MSLIFGKAPLVELVAELRWVPASMSSRQFATPSSPGTLQIIMGDNKTEEFLMRLGVELYQSNFRLSERLVMPGFPWIPGQPVVRYKADSPTQKSVLYQAGLGMFSVNAVPPYHSWEQFSPFVRSGIQALLRARSTEEQTMPFAQVSLRYIDFFGEDFIKGKSLNAFLASLGISMNLPVALAPLVTSPEARSIYWKTVLPVAAGSVSVSIGDGTVNNQFGIVLDTIVVTDLPTTPDLGEIMKTLDSAHEITNRFFVKLTEPIHELMQPQGATS
jgi:uncharacterized protein (TIGR04255 family)